LNCWRFASFVCRFSGFTSQGQKQGNGHREGNEIHEHAEAPTATASTLQPKSQSSGIGDRVFFNIFNILNIFNHPNFGSPNNTLSSPLFGHSTQMLASFLGPGGSSGGFNPLYQIGGPRSIQLALKLQF
jgi:hypothetical protein